MTSIIEVFKRKNSEKELLQNIMDLLDIFLVKPLVQILDSVCMMVLTRHL